MVGGGEGRGVRGDKKTKKKSKTAAAERRLMDGAMIKGEREMAAEKRWQACQEEFQSMAIK